MRLTRTSQRLSHAEYDSIDAFYRSTRRCALITYEEQITLARKVQRWVALRDAGRKLTSEEQREFDEGKRARDRMVMANTRFVSTIVRECHASGSTRRDQGGAMDFADMLQEGHIGLCTAVERFDPTRGYKFTTYARWWIKQQVLRGVYTKGRTIRLPEKMAQVVGKAAEVTSRLAVALGRNPTMEELAQELDVPANLLTLALHRGGRPVSLDATWGEDGSVLHEVVADDAPVPDDEEWSGYDVGAWLRWLTPRQRECVEAYYGLKGEEPLTHPQIAQRLGVSRSAVQKDLHKAMVRLSALARCPVPPAPDGTPALQCA